MTTAVTFTSTSTLAATVEVTIASISTTVAATDATARYVTARILFTGAGAALLGAVAAAGVQQSGGGRHEAVSQVIVVHTVRCQKHLYGRTPQLLGKPRHM